MNLDCRIERSNLFEAICTLLSKAAFPVGSTLGSVHLLSLEGIHSILAALASRSALAIMHCGSNCLLRYQHHSFAFYLKQMKVNIDDTIGCTELLSWVPCAAIVLHLVSVAEAQFDTGVLSIIRQTLSARRMRRLTSVRCGMPCAMGCRHRSV